MRRAVGVGIASALKSPHSRSKTSRAFVTAETSTGQIWTLSAQLAKSNRTRVEEDVAVAHIALTLLECVQTNTSPIPLGQRFSTKAGDTWEVNRLQPDYADAKEATRASICHGVERILHKGDESVMLLPFPTESGVCFRCIQRNVLPPHSIVFPGSFNPVHEGHVELAKASMAKTDSKMAFFELSITNADKPALSLDTVIDRLEKFLQIPMLQLEENTSILSRCRWGVILTNAPLFKQKVDILQPLHISRTDNKPKPLPFVIGTDTLVRLVDPKYYNHSYEAMVEAIEDMACDFVVGGRLEQKKSDETATPTFVSGSEEIDKLPDSIRSKFTALEDFRVDISSTEIRRQQSNEKS
jgi:nicotinic acid mononucleotide adenylyltransferase